MRSLILLSMLMSQSVFANSWCRNDEHDVSVRISEQNGFYETYVEMGGEELPALGECVRKDRKPEKYVRCSHGNDEYRLEVYPWAKVGGEKILPPSAILWHERKAKRLKLPCE